MSGRDPVTAPDPLAAAKREHAAEKDRDYWADYPGNEPATKPAPTGICNHCIHMDDQHGVRGCTVTFSSGIGCKCPKPGARV